MDPTQSRQKVKKVYIKPGPTGGEVGRTGREALEALGSYCSLVLYADSGLQGPHESPLWPSAQPLLRLAVPPPLALSELSLPWCQGRDAHTPTLCAFNFLPGILGLPETSCVLDESN